MEKNPRLKSLFNKYAERQCSAAELDELLHLLQDPHAEEMLDPEMRILWQAARNGGAPAGIDWQRMHDEVVRRGRDTDKLLNKVTSLRTNRPYLVATLVILIFIFLIFWMISRQAQKEMQILHKETPVIKNAK